MHGRLHTKGDFDADEDRQDRGRIDPDQEPSIDDIPLPVIPGVVRRLRGMRQGMSLRCAGIAG